MSNESRVFVSMQGCYGFNLVVGIILIPDDNFDSHINFGII